MVSEATLRILCLCYIGKFYITGGEINGAVTNRAEVIDLANPTANTLHFLLCRCLVTVTPQQLQVHVSSCLRVGMNGVN